MAPLLDASPSSTRVSLVGLGHMGTAIAERLHAASYPLFLFNRPGGRDGDLVGRGATRLDSLADALVTTDVCVTSLSDDDAVEHVLLAADGILSAAKAGAVLIETSTISVAASTRVAAAASEHGVHYLRAPISGNPSAIASGKAAVFVSGPSTIADACRPLLLQIGPTVEYVGDGEEARTLKLVLQVMLGGTAALLSEALVLGEAAGLSRKTLLDAIAASAAGSRFVEYKTESLLRDDYSATFTTSMMVKDVELVLQLARTTGTDLPITSALRSLLESACDHGHADDDFVSLVLELKERSSRAAQRKAPA